MKNSIEQVIWGYKWGYIKKIYVVISITLFLNVEGSLVA